MVNQASRTHQAVNRGLPPNWEMNYDDDEPPPLVQYETDSSDDQIDDENDLQWEEPNRRKQINGVFQQNLDELHRKVNMISARKMNLADIQQTMDETAALRQQVDRFNQQYTTTKFQRQTRQPLQRLDGVRNNNDQARSNLQKGGQQQGYQHEPRRGSFQLWRKM